MKLCKGNSLKESKLLFLSQYCYRKEIRVPKCFDGSHINIAILNAFRYINSPLSIVRHVNTIRLFMSGCDALRPQTVYPLVVCAVSTLCVDVYTSSHMGNMLNPLILRTFPMVNKGMSCC